MNTTPEKQIAEAKPSRGLRWLRRGLIALVSFITLIALVWTVESWRGKRAWERFKLEQEAKGERLDFSAYVPPAVPDEQNFVMTPVLAGAFDFKPTPEGIVRENTNAYTRFQEIKNAFQPPAGSDITKPRLTNLERGELANLRAFADLFRSKTNFPQNTAATNAAEVVLTALGGFDPELSELREAARTRPYARYPIDYDREPAIAILLPHLEYIRAFAQLLQLRAIATLDLGSPDEAWQDIKTILRLSDSLKDEPTLISYLVRIATLNIGLGSIYEGLARHGWTDAQLIAIGEELRRIDILEEYGQAMRGERAFNFRATDDIRRLGLQMGLGAASEDPGARAVVLMPRGWFDQNKVVIGRMHSECLLPIIDSETHRAFPDMESAMTKRLESLGFRPYTIFAHMMLPALVNTCVRSARVQTALDSAQLACAIERFRLARGELPGSLDLLAPQFIPEVPHDVIEGKPLRYVPNGNGGYLLYSIGWNQTDDGGTIVKGKGSSSRAQAAHGDWVWQMPPPELSQQATKETKL